MFCYTLLGGLPSADKELDLDMQAIRMKKMPNRVPERIAAKLRRQQPPRSASGGSGSINGSRKRPAPGADALRSWSVRPATSLISMEG